MWLMLQADRPDDYVLATNRTETVRDFVTMSFKAAGIDVSFQGSGKKEIGVNKNTGTILVKINPAFYRPAEVEILQGSSDKALKFLGWKPTINLEDLCKKMVEADLERHQ